MRYWREGGRKKKWCKKEIMMHPLGCIIFLSKGIESLVNNFKRGIFCIKQSCLIIKKRSIFVNQNWEFWKCMDSRGQYFQKPKASLKIKSTHDLLRIQQILLVRIVLLIHCHLFYRPKIKTGTIDSLWKILKVFKLIEKCRH